MKIVLIWPTDPKGFLGHVSKSGKVGFARLTLTTLAALTPEKHDVSIIDSRISPIDFDMDVDLIGITALTSEVPSAYEIADKFRKKGVTVVMGGPHVSALPDESLEHADAVVVGEGERVWAKLVEDVENKRLKRKYKADSLCDMSEVKIPRRELLIKSAYTSFYTMQMTRGCPFNCNYCMVTKFFGNTYRVRPVEKIIEEIEKMDSKKFVFLDDNIVGQPDYAKELFKALIPLKIKWGSQGSITLADDPELLKLYSKSGGRVVFIGFESISQSGLKSLNKGWGKSGGYSDAIKRIHDAGIGIIGSFVFGLDEDTPDVFEKTVEFVFKNKLDAAMYNVLTPFPGTGVYDKLEKEGRIIDRDWGKYNTNKVVFRPKNMTPEELNDGYQWAYKETYTGLNILKRNFRLGGNLAHRFGLNYSYYRKVKKLFY